MLKSYYNFFKNEKKDNRFLKSVLLSLWALAPMVAMASWVNVRPTQQNAEGNKYWIGDRIHLQADAQNSLVEFQGKQLTLKPADANINLQEQGWFVEPKLEAINQQFVFTVVPIKSGKLTLPSLKVVDSEEHTLVTTAPWEVQSMADGLQAPKEELSLLPPEKVQLSWVLWALTLFVLLLLCALLIYLWKKYRSKLKPIAAAVPPSEPKQPSHLASLERLNYLYKLYPFQKEKLKPIAFGVSEILKDYLSTQLNIDAKESTTAEMMALLKQAGVGQSDLRIVKLLFDKLDFIKFTRYLENSNDFDLENNYSEFKTMAMQIIQRWAGGEVKVGVKNET